MNIEKEQFDVSQLPELLAPDYERLTLARQRQAAVWKGEKPDKPPILISAPLNQEQQQIPDANFKEAFYSKELMLCTQVRQACGVVNAKSDAVPSIRSNLGTGILLACIGLEQEVYDDKMPWLHRHLSREEVANLTPDDIIIQGSFDQGLEQMKFFREVMRDSINIYCMDTQGPFDLAHLIMGAEIFYVIHDDKDLLHHLMNFCVELGVKTHQWMKDIAGEPYGNLHHSNGLYSDSMGIRICEDASVMVGPDVMDEFITPYARRLAAEFGGAWVHYCGRNDELTRRILDSSEFKGINFGHIPGNMHDHPFEEQMLKCRESDTVYFGAWPPYDGETAVEYLKRMHEWAATGCLIPQCDAAMNCEEPFDNTEDVLDFWYSC